MRRSKWLGFVAAASCALMLGAGTSAATQSDKDHRQAGGASQYGKVENGTQQYADSKAKTEQENKNIPFSFFEVGTNNGKVDQFNKADTQSKSENSNKTWQDLNQDQNVKNEGQRGNDCGCNDKGWGNGKGRGDNGDDSRSVPEQQVGNRTKAPPESSAETEQTRVNVPDRRLFRVGSNNGKEDRSVRNANTDSSSSNWNKTSRSLNQDGSAASTEAGRSMTDQCQDRADQRERSHLDLQRWEQQRH